MLVQTCRGYADEVRMREPDSDKAYLDHLDYAHPQRMGQPPPLPFSPGQGVLRPIGGDAAIDAIVDAMELGSNEAPQRGAAHWRSLGLHIPTVIYTLVSNMYAALASMAAKIDNQPLVHGQLFACL